MRECRGDTVNYFELAVQDLINVDSGLTQLEIMGLSTGYRQGHPRKLWGSGVGVNLTG